MKTINLIPPNTEYLELNFVGETATGRGNNQQYVMENLHDGTFRGTESRVGITIGRHRPRSFQKKCPGAHCVWAHGRGTGGTTLFNDEVVVYDEAQSTIEYLIMMK